MANKEEANEGAKDLVTQTTACARPFTVPSADLLGTTPVMIICIEASNKNDGSLFGAGEYQLYNSP